MRDAYAADAPTTEAQLPAQVPYEASADKMMTENLLFLGLLFFIFYFLLIRPHQKRLRAHQEMTKGLQKGNRVITGGGIIGTIIKLEGDDIAVVEISPNVRVRIARSSISEVLGDKAPAGESANDN